MTGRPAFYRRWLSPEGYLGAHLAVGFVLALAAGWAFTELADEVFEGPELAADTWASDVLRARRHPTLTAVMKAISLVGQTPALVVMSLAVGAWLLRVHSHRRLIAFSATMAGGAILNVLLKALFQRRRPELAALSTAEGFSFPSGHSMGSMLFFGSLAYVVYFTIERRRRWRLPAVALCGLAVAAIGVSRVYLGVHYLSDVVAGYSAALCWMGVCLSGTEAWVRWRDWRRRRARRRGGHAERAGTVATVLVAGLAAATPGARAAESPPPCLACVVWQAKPEDADRALARSESLTGLRILVDERARGPATAAAVERRQRLAAAGARAGVRRDLDDFGEAAGPLAFVLVVVGGLPSDAASLDERAFRLKTVLVDLRARHPDAALGVEAAGSLAALWERGLSAYVDFVVGEDAGLPAGLLRWRRVTAPAETLPELIEATSVAADAVVLRWPADDTLPGRAARLQAVLPAGLTPLPDVVVACSPAGADRRRSDACASRAYLHPQTLEAVAVVHPSVPVEEALVRPAAARAVLHPLVGPPVAHTLPARGATGGGRIALPAIGSPFLLRIEGWSGAPAGSFTAGLEVRDERLLRVEEVIARHQAAAARQQRLVPRLIASGRMVLTFQVPGLAAPVTVTADTTLFVEDGLVEIEQRDIRLNGLDVVSAGANGVPRLPIIEPERVSQPPLAIALGDAYRYRLEGREEVHGHDCYVVAFEPLADGVSLFRGRAWIDRRTFAMVRSSAVQTGLRGSIVSSQQHDEFAPVSVGEEAAWLPARSEVTQVYEGPGHHTPIDRLLTFFSHEPNPPDFAARRAAAHASGSVILRATPEGFRYLKRAPERAGGAARVVAGKANRLRTLAAGVLIDPNISVPLPFAGLGIVDFDLFGTGTQLNAFLAVGFLQAAFSAPSLGGSRWQLHGQAFAVMAEYNDRAFRGGLEQYDESVRQRPARLSLALVRPFSPRLRLRAGYELSYTRLRRGELTANAFVVPPSPLVHGLRVSLERQQGRWTASAWWNPARRQRWAAWGLPGNPESRAAAAGFQRFGATLARSFVLGPQTVGRVEAAWMAGRNLDRFSRYTFDAFENRLRGYPTASIRYDRGVVIRSVLTWSPAGGRVRLDGFFDTAWARDPGLGPQVRRFSGLGAGLEFPLPARALASIEWGYGFEGRRTDGGKGTNVLRLTAYKVF